jgi:hypothetical protein
LRRGLQAYRANAGALAERALAAAYPDRAQLLGDESFAGMARAYWHHHAPVLGDVARWGAELPAFIAAAEQLAEEPYLADVARLDWAVHMAQSAADGPAAARTWRCWPAPTRPRCGCTCSRARRWWCRRTRWSPSGRRTASWCSA